MPKLAAALAGNVKVKVTINEKLEQRLTRFQKLGAEINELIEAKKALSLRILADTPPAGYDSPEWKVTPVHATSASHVSKEKLVALGVSAKIIQKATIAGVAYSFPKITNKADAKANAAARAQQKEQD